MPLLTCEQASGERQADRDEFLFLGGMRRSICMVVV